MGATAVEKILARASGKRAVKAGDVVEPRVDLAMSHENAALVINQFREIYEGTGLTAKPWDPSRIAIIFDHRVPAESAKTATNQKRVRAFVGEHGITKFHDVRGDVGGICHQILPERGYVRPGMVVVGTDSHTTSHGALGAFAFGIGATEMASAWALGVALNIEVPPTIRISVSGRFGKHVGPKDLILHLIGHLTAQGANFRVLEFTGETIANLSTSGRLVLCNMSVEAGATAGIVPGDAETVRYLREEVGVTDPIDLVASDADAVYEKTVSVDVSKLEPLVACPHTVDNVKPVSAVAGKPVQQVVIGSCTNGRLDDLAEAAAHRAGAPRGRRHAHARLPGLREDLGRGDEARVSLRLHGGGRRRHERGLRPVPRRPRGRARRRRDRDLDDEPELQGPDGQPGRGGLPRLARRRGGVRPDGRHHRPAEGALTCPARRNPRRPASRKTDSTRVILSLGRRRLDGRDLSGTLHGDGAALGDAGARVRGPPGLPGRDQGEGDPERGRHRGGRELRLRLLARAGRVVPEGARRRRRREELRAHLPAERDQPRAEGRRRARASRRTRATTISFEGGGVENRTKRTAFDVVPLPFARQAIIDAGGLIPFTRARLMARA